MCALGRRAVDAQRSSSSRGASSGRLSIHARVETIECARAFFATRRAVASAPRRSREARSRRAATGSSTYGQAVVARGHER